MPEMRLSLRKMLYEFGDIFLILVIVPSKIKITNNFMLLMMKVNSIYFLTFVNCIVVRRGSDLHLGKRIVASQNHGHSSSKEMSQISSGY